MLCQAEKIKTIKKLKQNQKSKATLSFQQEQLRLYVCVPNALPDNQQNHCITFKQSLNSLSMFKRRKPLIMLTLIFLFGLVNYMPVVLLVKPQLIQKELVKDMPSSPVLLKVVMKKLNIKSKIGVKLLKSEEDLEILTSLKSVVHILV